MIPIDHSVYLNMDNTNPLRIVRGKLTKIVLNSFIEVQVDKKIIMR